MDTSSADCLEEDKLLLDFDDSQSNHQEIAGENKYARISSSSSNNHARSVEHQKEPKKIQELGFLTHEDGVDAYGDDHFTNGYQDMMGMSVTSGVVTLKKENNFVGISIGGGAPLCPCLYIAQVFDNTPAARDGTLQSGDEIIGVNGVSAKGKTKVQAAKMIQTSQENVSITYNKLHADPSMGKTLDIVLKKAKHRLVEKMSAATADALGLSRAILCNDALVRKLEELRCIETEYRGLVDHSKRVLKAFYELLQVYRAFGNVFGEIGAREPQPRASQTFTQFANYHRTLEKHGIHMLRCLKPVSMEELACHDSVFDSHSSLSSIEILPPCLNLNETIVILTDLGTYLYKAIPDTQLTIKKYADAKFEYLSYCLKVKEMDDEEKAFNEMREPLYRVETGNYEYRLILRCRQEARAKFARLRGDVLVKLELLDNKHVQDVSSQLEKFVFGLATFHANALFTLDPPNSRPLFPIEMDLSRSAFQYESTSSLQDDGDEDDDCLLDAEEAKEEPQEQQPVPLLLPDL